MITPPLDSKKILTQIFLDLKNFSIWAPPAQLTKNLTQAEHFWAYSLSKSLSLLKIFHPTLHKVKGGNKLYGSSYLSEKSLNTKF